MLGLKLNHVSKRGHCLLTVKLTIMWVYVSIVLQTTPSQLILVAKKLYKRRH